MIVDERTLRVDLGVRLTQGDYQRLEMHASMLAHTTREVDVLVKRADRRPGFYEVSPYNN